MATVTGLTMENLSKVKKERDMLRKMFTKSCNELEMELTTQPIKKENIVARLSQIEDKGTRLFNFDEKIRMLTLDNDDDEEIEKEYEAVEKFREYLIMCRSKCEFAFVNERKEFGASSETGTSNVRRHFKLPKIELKKFDGDVRNWIGFWGQFRKIHEDNELDVEDKFQYLLQSMEPGSVAKTLVDSFPPSASNYGKAIEQLKTRFARDEFLIEVYVRELLNLVLKQASSIKTGMSLAVLFDKLETQLRALESLGVTSDKYAAMLYPLAESALPEEILRAWERYRSNINIKELKTTDTDKSINYLNILLDFLRSEVESEERISLARTSFVNEKETKNSTRSKLSTEKYKQEGGEPNLYTAASLFYAEKHGKKAYICIFCDGKSHSSQDCIKARSLSITERKEIVSKKNVCFGCLKSNHTIKKCKTFIKCIICGRRHYPILCSDLSISQSKENKISEIPKSRELNLENVLISHNTTGTLLQTVIVKLVSESGSSIVRALLDSASQRSYIISDCAKNMKLKKVRDEIIIQSVFGGKQSTPETHSLFDVTIEDLNSSFQLKLLALEQNKICNSVPRLANVHIMNLLKQKNIIVNDTKTNINEISLLLGADIFGKLLTGRVEMIDDLVAIETHLGWTLIGSFHMKNPVESLCCFNDIALSDLWSLDILGIHDPISIKKRDILEAEAIKHFYRTIKLNEEKRYEIKLPWIEGHPVLSNNKIIAENRLLATTKRLTSLGKYQDYDKVFKEWEQLGIIEEITSIVGNNKEHYIPHHPVIKESSSTTKIRPVFDASAIDKNGISLNSCLMKGPNLIELIPIIILKFRIGMIGVISDIKKAFLQISIASEDRDILRFLWWEDLSLKKLKIYRHTRVVFGISSSPFLLAATLSYHLNRAPEILKETSKKLLNSFYVDNCVTSVNNMEELSKFIGESKNLMSSAGFDLRGWVYNGPRFFSENNEELPLKENITPVLGLQWNIEKDTLCCDVHVLNEIMKIPTTKRGLLSAAQRIFDPIGFTCPVTLIPKLLLQETWKLKINWDTKLPDDIIKSFQKWLKQIHLLQLCSIPRSLFRINLSQKNVTIHIFCDASKLAYAACIFIRIETNQLTYSHLLQAKSRISPIKSVTLPRLELLAAVIGCRLFQFIKQVDYFQTLETYFWSDSKVVLTWIKTKSSWTTFVMNRVTEIRSNSNVDDWYHVPGDMNPADLPSRGCNCKQLLETKWWNGPDWLNKNKQFWPSSPKEFLDENALEESRKITISSLVNQGNDITSARFNYFSKYSRIIRMIAWMIRFSKKCRGMKIYENELTYEEVAMAEVRLMRIIQNESFRDTCSNDISNLTVFKDDTDLIRVKTKLVFADEVYSFKYPIILPYKHIIVRKLIEEQHNLSRHGGVQVILGILRERFWIIKARKMVKEVIFKCVVCKRFKTKSLETPFAPLPNDRLNMSATFEITGTDFAGPLYLKNEGKAWIVIFTCAVYRACHFELVRSLSTDAFLQALRRFIARRGRVSVIYSDNGTNYVGANNQLKNLDWNEILKFSSVQRITWKFNVPTAPWWGGWWERIVRMVKELLRRNLGKKTVDYEELMTILCDCEALINSRPLTYVSDDCEELVPITPSTFLQSIRSSEVPDLDEINRTNMKKRLRYLQKIRENLQVRFRNEYLAKLVHYGQRRNDKLAIGDIVLVGSDNTKRIDWPIGKILEIFPGRDNIPRVARIRISSGEILRPFQRIYPLEISTTNEESNILQGKLTKDRHISKNIETSEEKQPNKRLPDEEGKETISSQKKEKDHTAVSTRSGRLVKVPDRYGY